MRYFEIICKKMVRSFIDSIYVKIEIICLTWTENSYIFVEKVKKQIIMIHKVNK
jgi:hypothetical protein